MRQIRTVDKVLPAKATVDGAGVKLNRVFGYYETPHFDPFLLLDHFKSDNPDDYMAGFPWHPHRGIETVTYMLKGSVEHGDSMGNKGIIEAGDVQWMTAGSGIIHQEMPVSGTVGIEGFQLWVNLPSEEKMTAPKYREVKKESIPTVTLENYCTIKIICGEVNGVKGPVEDLAAGPQYLDVHVPKDTTFELAIDPSHNVFAYPYSGEGTFGSPSQSIEEKHVILFNDDGDTISVVTSDTPLNFLLVSGKALNESIAWRGPIVMNTEEELNTAFLEYETNTFIK